MAKVAQQTLIRARKLRRKLTDAEVILWTRLRKDAQGVRFRRQHPIGPYAADFACVPARLIVEVDGATHSTDAELEHDRRRDSFMRAHGWLVVRVSNTEVYENLGGVIEGIRNAARLRLRGAAPSTASRSPSPSR